MASNGKKVLVLGKGGREHAIVKKLAQSDKVAEIHVFPGNYGTAQEPKTTNKWADVKLKNYDLVVVGPEDALANGVANQCKEVNVPCFGPTEQCAMIESSKIFSKEVMKELKIPTASYVVPSSVEQIDNLKVFPVVKKNGLCAGKGVYMTKNHEEFVRISKELLEKKEKFLVEKRLYGEEVTVMAFTDGKTLRMMPPVRDYKRLLDGDNGPNTGSMGSYCPAFNILPKEPLMGFVKKAIVQKVIDYFQGNYVGVIYVGLMMTEFRIKVLEFNARFGDSECQVVLPLLKNDLFDVMMACTNKTLHEHKLEWSEKHCVIVNAASSGYPNISLTGYHVNGDPDIYAGVNDEKMTCGGRVFGCIGRQPTLKTAREEAYEKLSKVSFSLMQYRTDIGWVQRPKRVVVLGSTRGTDLGFLYEYIEEHKLNAEIVAVISNKAGAYILKRAYDKGTPTFKISNNQKLEDVLDRLEFDLIALIGYMRIIPDNLVRKYAGQMINVHPSLLPAFAGGMDLDVHQAVLDAGVKFTGCTVHQVTEVVDGGEILVQKMCHVLPKDTKESLKEKVQELEGEALAKAIEMLPYQQLDERKYTVDIEGGNDVVKRIRPQIEKTLGPAIISPWGAFAGCFDMSVLSEYKEPVLVSSVDSVGSKILLSQKYDHLNYIGYDLVNHCVNDILVMGAKPLFFLDYVASAKLNTDEMVKIINGVAHACEEQKVALIGGETAEIREMYQKNATDLVGMIVGVVEKSRMITGEKIKEGDLVFGIPSSGFHTNGFTLVNKYANEHNVDELLEPHRCYLTDLKDRLDKVSGLVHITGGGWFDNPKRVLPKNLAMEIRKYSWKVPNVFGWIQKVAKMNDHEMFKTFNMGVGMLVIVPKENEEQFNDLNLLGFVKKRDFYPVELR